MTTPSKTLEWVQEQERKAIERREELERARREEQAAKRAAQLKADEEMFSSSLEKRIPLLDGTNYPLPNCFARSALFAAVKESDREMLRDQKIFSLQNYEITYTGDQLNQSDLDVFMALLCERMNTPFGEEVFFSAYSILRRMNWSANSVGYERLEQCIKRLQRAQIEVRYNRGEEDKHPVRYVGSFVKNFLESDDRPLRVAGTEREFAKSRWVVRMDVELTKLFVNEDVTLGLWYLRRKIDGRQPLAQYLLSYLITHKKPLPVTFRMIKELSGSSERNETNFVYRAEKALTTLVAIGVLKRWWVTDGRSKSRIDRVIHVERVDPAVLARRARDELQSSGEYPKQLALA